MVEIPPEVGSWLAEIGQGEVLQADSITGGCIHQARSLATAAGGRYVLKTNPAPQPGIFTAEAAGLRVLQVPDGPVVPAVYLEGPNFLLLEDLQPGPRRSGFWPIYGRQLAQVHSQSHHCFGFAIDNYIGSKPQKNDWLENGHDFFREMRLRPQIQWAVESGFLDHDLRRAAEKLLARLEDLLPGGPPVLIHGDLWSGNLITDKDGNPALIDPAVYYGWAEADLAMAELFGSYPNAFYSAYQEINPLSPGFRKRFPLYNLYHLLNHLNLFGRSYLSAVREILVRFA